MKNEQGKVCDQAEAYGHKTNGDGYGGYGYDASPQQQGWVSQLAQQSVSWQDWFAEIMRPQSILEQEKNPS